MMSTVGFVAMIALAAILLVVLLGRRNVREGRRVGREMAEEERQAKSESQADDKRTPFP